MIRMELASGTGRGCKMTPCTIAKRAVLAAMQTAKVRTTVTAKPLSRHKDRRLYFKSRRNASMTSESLHCEVMSANLSRNPTRIQYAWITNKVPYRRGRGNGNCKASGSRSEEHTSELQSRGHLVCRL